MAMNPRDAANAKGCIDSVISFTKTKLLPHVPEMMIRFTHSVESGTFPMHLPQINFDRFAETTIRRHRIGSYQGVTPSCVALLQASPGSNFLSYQNRRW